MLTLISIVFYMLCFICGGFICSLWVSILYACTLQELYEDAFLGSEIAMYVLFRHKIGKSESELNW